MNAFSHTLRCLEQGITDRQHLGAQIAILREGCVMLHHACGGNRPGEPLTTEHLMPWLSSGKPLTAVAVLQLMDRGLIQIDTRIAEVIPGFGRNGKEPLTVRHLLTHTAGMRDADKVSEHLDWPEAVERVCASPIEPGWQPGTMAAYHLTGSWIILGELIRRLDGRMPHVFVREEICLKTDLPDTHMAMDDDTFEQNRHRLGLVHLTFDPSIELHPFLNRERSWKNPRPGGGMRGPVLDLARFYQQLLKEAGPLLKPDTRRRFISRQRKNRFDQTFQHVIDWGLGVMINSNRHGRDTVPYMFGPHAGESAFGHSGMQTSCAFADPENQLAVAWVCNGMPGEQAHQARARRIHRAIYEDLGLVRIG